MGILRFLRIIWDYFFAKRERMLVKVYSAKVY